MIIRTIGQIASMIGAYRKGGQPDQLIKGIMTDTRVAGNGELFIPIIGDRLDGHAYAHQAVKNGAKALLWTRGREVPEDLLEANVAFLLVADTLSALQQLAAAYRNELQVRVIGITGSNGKTTTKDMTAALLSTMYKVLKTEGNLNNHIGLPLTLLKLEEDTEVAVLEMGMSGYGEIELLSTIAQPNAAIITNVGDAHMLQLGSRAGIAKAKLEIIHGLSEDGILFYNGDEPLLEEGLLLSKKVDGMQLRTFGLTDKNDWSAADMQLDPFSSRFIAMNSGRPSSLGNVHIPVPGQHNISNALAAIAVARSFGVQSEHIHEGFRTLQLTGMRIEPSEAFNKALILNDSYNANPTAVYAAIDLMSSLSGFRLRWLVLGDMLELGPEEVDLHRKVGEYMTDDKAEGVLTYGTLSRHLSEAASIALVQAKHEGRIKHFDDKDELACWLLSQLAPEDIVLVKGSRGMRMEQVVQALEKG